MIQHIFKFLQTISERNHKLRRIAKQKGDQNDFCPASLCLAIPGQTNHLFNLNLELSHTDPNLSSNQRINILVKKIQELKKTYLMIKNEMNAKDRRRKKHRRRERENKQKQTAKVA
jgi:ribosome-binding ATPase YchF (GTP1/OBG family)